VITVGTHVDVRAAGGVLWRRTAAGPETLLIHRPRYDDWSFPKGKVKPAEDLRTCAIREIMEETQVPVALRRPLGVVRYRLGNGLRKEVTYWVAVPLPEDHPAVVARPIFKKASKNEIDHAMWLPAVEAVQKLTSPQDREILERLLAWERQGTAETMTLIMVRHARAIKRSNWKNGKGAEATRPLTAQGTARARAIASQLAAYGVRLVESSPWMRCTATMRSYCEAAHVRLVEHPEFTEAAYAEHKKPMAQELRRVVNESQDTAALCLHRPTLPTVIRTISRATDPDIRSSLPSSDPYLKTGELLVLHVVRGTGKKPHIVSVEQYRPAIM
jgi:8-oxo-dGTP pyrophosphatase MutT (NUDIX family)/phosphohistidine phosphatase SixA